MTLMERQYHQNVPFHLSAWQTHQKYHYTRDGDVVISEVPRPQLVSLYFDAASKIDVHNHLRQGLLNIEDAWGTQTWWQGLAATFIGVIVTDAFLDCLQLRTQCFTYNA